jgi:hypothetical protein
MRRVNKAAKIGLVGTGTAVVVLGGIGAYSFVHALSGSARVTTPTAG